MSVFRQPTFQKNALHEYLDNEDADADAATGTYATASGGAYTETAGFEGQRGWGEQKFAAGEMKDHEEEQDEEMKVWWVWVVECSESWSCVEHVRPFMQVMRLVCLSRFVIWFIAFVSSSLGCLALPQRGILPDLLNRRHKEGLAAAGTIRTI